MTIFLTVTESTRKKVDTIPVYLTVSTDVISSIFYTFDGSDPTTDSDIYIDSIQLPTNSTSFTVKIWATNGSDQSDIYSKSYSFTFVGTDIATVNITNVNDLTTAPRFPFGDNLQAVGIQTGTKVAGSIVVDDLSVSNTLDGYDGAGNQVGYSDETADYIRIYSETNRLGQTGRGIGTLPAQVTYQQSASNPDYSSVNDKFFNPKAKLIFQSYLDTNNQDVTPLNRSSFISGKLNPTEYSKVGTGQSHILGSGTALRQQFNPKDSTITYYYFDSKTLQYIKSVEKFIPNSNSSAGSVVISNRQQGSGYVFKWYPFFRKNNM